VMPMTLTEILDYVAACCETRKCARRSAGAQSKRARSPS